MMSLAIGKALRGANPNAYRCCSRNSLLTLAPPHPSTQCRHSGLDVDKMDYYARDQKRTLSVGQVDVILIEECFVARGKCSRPYTCFSCKDKKCAQDHYMICWPEKLVVKGLEFFKTRFSMHSNVYTHKTVKAVEYMICDALVLADPWVAVPSRTGGKSLRISQALSCPDNYINLKDSILDIIESSVMPELQRSRWVDSSQKSLG